MRYAEARDLIKDGDIVAFTHRKWSSFYDAQVMLVRMGTASKFCHVGQVWAIGRGATRRLFVLEAVTPYVRLVPLSHFAKEGFWWVNAGMPMSDAEFEHALSQVAVAGYSKWQAVLAFLGRLKLGADVLTQCCEYVIENRRRSGVPLGAVAVPQAVVDEALKLPGATLRSVEPA